MKKAYKKTVQTEIVQTVDSSTGELLDISTKKVEVLVKDKEEFFFLYSHILGILDSITRGPELSILSVIIFKHVTTSGYVYINDEIKADIAQRCGISISSVSKGLKSLAINGILKHSKRGVYSLNPNYAWKGTTSTRNEKLKFDLTITTEHAERFL